MNRDKQQSPHATKARRTIYKRPSKMTQAEARAWLIEHDPQAAQYWRDLPEGSDFKTCVQDNLRDFGPHKAGNILYVTDSGEGVP